MTHRESNSSQAPEITRTVPNSLREVSKPRTLQLAILNQSRSQFTHHAFTTLLLPHPRPNLKHLRHYLHSLRHKRYSPPLQRSDILRAPLSVLRLRSSKPSRRPHDRIWSTRYIHGHCHTCYSVLRRQQSIGLDRACGSWSGGCGWCGVQGVCRDGGVESLGVCAGFGDCGRAVAWGCGWKVTGDGKKKFQKAIGFQLNYVRFDVCTDHSHARPNAHLHIPRHQNNP